MKEYEQKIYNIINNAEEDVIFQAHQAYKQGYEDRKADTPFTDTKEAEDKAYNRGLNDAWEVIKKITKDDSVGGYSIEMMQELFGRTCVYDITHNYTPEEAIAKIREYEDKQKQDAKIKVGDEVKHQGFRSVVVRIADDCIYTISECGTTPKYCKDDDLVKTGRHFDEIAEVLAELRGAENDE